MFLTSQLSCTDFSIRQGVPLQIWESLTEAGQDDLPLVLIRFLHNKPRYYFVNYAKCYLHYLNPSFFIYQFGLAAFIIVLLIILNIYKHLPRARPVLISLMLIYPLFMVFELYKLFL